MKSVRVHPAADEELVEATAWYIKKSALVAAGFVREIEHAIARIAEAPERYPLTRFRGRRRVGLENLRAKPKSDEMRPHYDFEYSKSRPNRFANRFSADAVIVMLDTTAT